MYDTMGMLAAASGVAQAMQESVDEEARRADKAERKLARVRALCRPGKHYVKYQGHIESIADVVVRIIDEDT